MPTLSVMMIVKNEAHCLSECLESVRTIADELVVADTGSTDETPQIAQNFGAQVFSIPWQNDFAQARNQAMSLATGDWLLQMDADEILDPTGAACIRALVDADGMQADAIEVIQANYCNEPRAWRWTAVPADAPYAHGFAGYLRVPILRLFRNQCGFEYREMIHENITESVIEHQGRIRHEEILIHHYGFAAEGQRAKTKAQLYLKITRTKMEQHPNDLKALHDFAEQAMACGLPEEAETACRKALEIHPFQADSVMTLSNILLGRGEIDEADYLLNGLVQTNPEIPHAEIALGAIAYQRGELTTAKTHLEKALVLMPSALLAKLYLARVADCMGEGPTAIALLQDVCTQAPGIEEGKARLQAHQYRTNGETAFQAGKIEEAISHWLAALRLDKEDPLLYNDLGVAQYSLGNTQEARNHFKRALQLVKNQPDALENLAALQ